MFRPTLRRLEVFVAAVEAGGFRACSDALGISQAAVSNHVKHLEEELGYQLFVRRRGAVGALTARGVSAYREAKDLLDHASKLSHVDGSLRTTGARRLAVSADAIVEGQLAGQIARFIEARPDIEVSLERSWFEAMVDGLHAGKVDIAYFYAAGPVAEVESELVWREPVCICAHESHAVFSHRVSSLSELRRYGFVAPARGLHFRRTIDKLLNDQGLADYPIALETGNPNMAREAVISGLAISGVITRYLDEELSRHGVRAVPVPGCSLALEVRRSVRRELRLDRSAMALTDFLDHGARVSEQVA